MLLKIQLYAKAIWDRIFIPIWRRRYREWLKIEKKLDEELKRKRVPKVNRERILRIRYREFKDKIVKPLWRYIIRRVVKRFPSHFKRGRFKKWFKVIHRGKLVYRHISDIKKVVGKTLWRYLRKKLRNATQDIIDRAIKFVYIHRTIKTSIREIRLGLEQEVFYKKGRYDRIIRGVWFDRLTRRFLFRMEIIDKIKQRAMDIATMDISIKKKIPTVRARKEAERLIRRMGWHRILTRYYPT